LDVTASDDHFLGRRQLLIGLAIALPVNILTWIILSDWTHLSKPAIATVALIWVLLGIIPYQKHLSDQAGVPFSPVRQISETIILAFSMLGMMHMAREIFGVWWQ
jgi:hypothetical protein